MAPIRAGADDWALGRFEFSHRDCQKVQFGGRLVGLFRGPGGGVRDCSEDDLALWVLGMLRGDKPSPHNCHVECLKPT